MSRNKIIDSLEREQFRKRVPKFRIGDTVKVFTKIVEGNKERTQAISGTVVARNGKGISETVTLYRTAYGSAMEKVFMLHSPRVEKVELVRAGKVRRSKLYYLRGTFGKKAKVKENIGVKITTEYEEIAPLEEPQEAEKVETEACEVVAEDAAQENTSNNEDTSNSEQDSIEKNDGPEESKEDSKEDN